MWVRWLLPALVTAAFSVVVSPAALAQCSSPANPIVAENCRTGNPQSEWDISGVGDATIQGFTTDISANAGQVVTFKVSTDASSYRLDIYRMGYYGGMGARKVATVNPSARLPQTQPSCLTDGATKLIDCGNWAVSASWIIPANATSGIYFAHLVRADTGGDSHIFFIVRNDASHSDMLFQTGDESWQAYNPYGGESLYGETQFDIPNRAFKVSYNRPFNTANLESVTWVFGAEYPMVRWLEANGYDVTYFSGVDGARSGALLKNHKVILSVGHDEYWSGPRRANVEAARDAGVNLAFFSGNEVFWKTRWENSIDGSGTPYRTLVCYKETLSAAKIDPTPAWTGTWADPSFSPPADGGRPQNTLTGTYFEVNGPGSPPVPLSIQVPAADGQMRFWRNTAIAGQPPGQVATLPAGTLGYEWDGDADNGARPKGLFQLSSATYSSSTQPALNNQFLLDFGSSYGPGTATHHLTMYRAPSGALVFGAGTVQWSWGLDDNHSHEFYSAPAPDPRMQQATINLFADMGVQPASIQPGVFAATKSTDVTSPTSQLTSPAAGAVVTGGTAVTISGTATDLGGGVVGGVEVSTDAGATWHPAVGRGTWTYSWTPKTLGGTTIKTRAVDDSGNVESPGPGSAVTVVSNSCPCSLWSPSPTPGLIDSGDGGSIEVGIKFRSDYDGFITGLRFYKSSANTGSHLAHLWSSGGSLLATAPFTSETASGWQQVSFTNPVAITAGTVYVASYFAPGGHYSADVGYFSNATVDNPPMHSAAGTNGLYTYGSTPSFPASTSSGSNYWVDVVYIPAGSIPGAPASMLISQTTFGFSASIGQGNPPAQTVKIYNQGGGTLTWTATASAPWIVITPNSGTMPTTASISVNTATLAAGNYSGTVTVNASGGKNPSQVINVSLSLFNTFLASSFATTGIEGWAVSPLGLGSNWSVVNTALQNNGGGHTQLYAGNSTWTDYNLQAAIKLSTLSDFPGGIRGRVDPVSGAAYTAWLYPAEGLIKLFKNVAWNINSGFTLLGQAGVTFDNQNFHNVGLSFKGTQIQVLYDGNVLISATDASYASGMIALDVSNQVISFNNITMSALTGPATSVSAAPNTLSFSGTFQGANPASKTVGLSTTGTGSLAWTAVSTVPWLSVSPASGATPASLAVSANLATLAPGTYNGAIRVTALSASNSPISVNVTLTVAPPPAALSVTPASFQFLAVQTQGAPAAQTLSVVNSSGPGSFSWTAASDSAWLSTTPASGTAPGSTNVSVNPTGLPLGNKTGQVTITATGIANSPQTIPVKLTVLAPALTENFAGLGSGWIISPMGQGNGWSASNATYTYNGSGLSQSCAGNSSWTDYQFDANIRLSNLSNWPGGIRGRVNPSTGAGYAVWVYPGSGIAVLYKVAQWSFNGPGVTALAQAPLTFDTTAYHDLQMVFLGNQILVKWDGQQLIAATDSTYTGGYVCLDGDNQPISYQNVRVASVQPPITLTGAPASVSFTSAPGATPPSQSFAIATGSTATTTWGVTSSAAWLNPTLSSTTAPGNLVVAVNGTGLPAGSYSGTVTLYAPGAANSTITIPVSLNTRTAVLAVSPASLAFTGAPNGVVSVTNTGTGSLAWTASADSTWIGLSATSGTAPASITVTPNGSGLAPGTYTGKITVASADVGNGPLVVNVSMTINPPTFLISPAALTFQATQNTTTMPQNLTLTNSGYGSASWTAAADSSWITITPGSGTLPSSISVKVNATGLATGHYSGNVIVSGPGVTNSPQSIPVSANVMASSMTETFSSAAGWNISPMGLAAGWSVANATYSYNGGGLSQSCAGNSGWTDYSFDTNIKLATLSNWPGGVRGRVNPSTGAGYVVWLYPGSGSAILYAVPQWNINGGGAVILAQVPLSYDTTSFHDLQMVFAGNKISVYWDNGLLMSATDSKYASGYVCMDAATQATSYQNVRVAGTQGPITVTGVPASVNFSFVGGAAPPPQTFNLAAGGASSTWGITTTGAWLSAALSSSMTPGTLTVSANPAGLAEGTYSGSVTLYTPGATNYPVVIPVTFAVKTAALAVSPSSLAFFGATDSNPPTQSAAIRNAGSGSLLWTASADSPWIGLGATSGAAPASLSVSANSKTLAVGSYTGNVTVASADVANGPITIPVSLNVGTTVFTENFATGAGNWTISPLGNATGWSVATGTYSYNGQGATQSWAGSATWTNYTAAVDFKLASLNDYPGGIRGRLNTSTGAGYGAWIYPAEGVIKLYRIGQWSIDAGFSLVTQSNPIAFDTNFHNLRFNFQGSQIQVYYDNTLVIQASDSTYTQGAIAFDVSNQPIAFKNVAVIGF